MDSANRHLHPLHPRRVPAQRSVSLLHSGRPTDAKVFSPLHAQQQAKHSSASNSSPSSLKPLTGRDDSGESSNADQWFEKSNNNITARAYDDPPFFLQQSSEESTPPQGLPLPLDKRYAPSRHGPNTTLQQRELLRHGTDGSSNDDFRGVIDDLTVENKKLKRRLRRYEKLHDAHLKDEKLFEVRVHELPASKKKELEDMLRRFALGLQQEHSLPASSSTTNPHQQRLVPALHKQKTNASHNSQFTDSAYASASASGQGGSSAPSASASGHNPYVKDTFRQPAQARHQSIHTYLHDIPSGLLPKQPAAMSEKTKMKLAVRRLEQLFSGKGAEKGAHHHPLQQQEVSRIAAQADRSRLAALGRNATAEGRREARIMEEEMDETPLAKALMSLDQPSRSEKPAESTLQHIDPAQQTAECDFAEPSSSLSPFEQRPARPLDLDLQRAQVPSENFQYIRHLGFSPSHNSIARSPTDSHGWVYLNLLVNMAQLHTINVTPDFVKKALQQYSTNFELSSDGRKVRWKPSSGYARTYSDADDTLSSTPDEVQDGQSARKRVKLSHTECDASNPRPECSAFEDRQHKLSYTPLFFHNTSEDSDVSSSSEEDDATDSPWFAPQDEEGQQSGVITTNSHTTNTGRRNVSAKRYRKRENGPIIFYNNARFFTDLSGDHGTEAAMVYNHILYHTVPTQPVGSDLDQQKPRDDEFEKKGPLNEASKLTEVMELPDNSSPTSVELTIPPQTPITSVSDKSPMTMEVSGVGGVYPADNFAINVNSRYGRTGRSTSRIVGQNVHPKLADILVKNKEGPNQGGSMFDQEVLSARQRSLPPSELPPASCFISVDGSDSDDESDIESEVFDLSGALNAPPPAAAPQLLNMASLDSCNGSGSGVDEDGEEGEDDCDDDDMSDGSVDLLAAARELDPDSIRESERIYEAEMAERLAEDIPAGSSAATAAGGSGFASPASGMGAEEAEAARRAHREKQMRLQSAYYGK